MTKKEKIIHVALDLFAKHGYTETSISKIAKAAGVSKGLTYTHFKNKDDLLRAVVMETLGSMTAELVELQKLNIVQFLQLYFQMLKAQRDVIRLCMLLVVHPETPQIVKDMLAVQQEELLKMLAHLLSPYSNLNSDMEARMLLATLDGLTLEYITTTDDELLDNLEAHLLSKYAYT